MAEHPLIERLPAVPDLLALARHAPQRYPCLLESLARGQAPARFDLLFASTGEALQLASDGRSLHGSGSGEDADFLAALDRWQASLPPLYWPQTELPTLGGWVLYLGYELAAQIEPRLHLPHATDGLPQALALRTPLALIHDHQQQCTWLVAEPGHAELLATVRADLELQLPAVPPAQPQWELHEDPPQRFLLGVERVLEYLRAGDSFQVNLSRAWQAHTAQPPEPTALYQRLRQSNPAPFAGLLQHAGRQLLSSSPERLVSVVDSLVQTRPIAGTRARSDDDTQWRELPRIPKERAEHVMLIDLERNDLGRVCVPGTVEVDELLGLESYAHVHHIVSNVRGRLRDGVSATEVIRACFPGGTITGCPKVRSMEIIAELEGSGRGAYTGALGYLDRRGHMDLNILIRSMVLEGTRLSLRTGAGIVVDSVPQRELEETRVKAEGLLRALR